MSIESYKEALKSGQRAYRHDIFHGRYPYLPALDDFISQLDIVTELSLGLAEIPLEKVVGTRTAGRKESFASNFMPLLDSESEFALKWSNLYDSLQDSGLRDPVKAYEYMDRYYILEGNKRVSVMKFLGAVSIPATVVRMVPRPNDSRENRLYYEYMHFYTLSQINYLEFSQPGSYRKLQAALGKGPDESWTDDEKLAFHSFYIRFEDAYRKKAGSKLPMSVSDALLVYLAVYPYEISRNHMPSTFKENMAKSWDEFLAGSEDNAVALSMNPEGVRKKKLAKLITTTTKAAKVWDVAFIYDKTPETSAWTYSHELGRLHLQQKFPDKIRTHVYQDVPVWDEAASQAVIEQAASDGCQVIFTTTPKLLNASFRAAVEYSKVRILNCSVNTTHPSIRSYYARMYEVKFLIGAAAGILCDNQTIGYVADYPIYGATANINAFALGVKMTNPCAKVQLEWSKVKGDSSLDKLKRRGVRFISDKDILVPQDETREFGLYFDSIRGEGSAQENLAVPVWHWGVFYELLLRSVFSGAWSDDTPDDGVKALNYWWGMSAGVVDLICSDRMPEGTRRLLHLLKNEICSGSFHPFSGTIRDQAGNYRHEGDTPMLPEEIIEMNCLVDNVVGTIPVMDELEEGAKEIVRVQGVNKTDEGEPV